MQSVPAAFELVKSPTGDWIASALGQCKERFIACSPYVGSRLRSLIGIAPSHVRKTLVTRLNIRDFALRASSISIIRALADSGVEVYSLANLHAKVYVFDTAAALVTSANATQSGMQDNLELGVALGDPPTVAALADEVLAGFGGDAKPEAYDAAEIGALEKLVERVEARIPPPVDIDRLAEEERAIIEVESTENLLDAFAGWRRLTLAGVIAQHGDEFRLENLYRDCIPQAAREYPGNRYPKAKLRQQLQSLGDLGLLEFLGGGRYRKTFRTRLRGS